MKEFRAIGLKLAGGIFRKRSRNGVRNAEVHVTEAELAAICTLAAEHGATTVRGHILTDKEVRAARCAISAMLAGEPHAGDWPEDVATEDLVGARDALDDPNRK